METEILLQRFYSQHWPVAVCRTFSLKCPKKCLQTAGSVAAEVEEDQDAVITVSDVETVAERSDNLSDS